MRCGDRILVFGAGTGVRPFGLSLPSSEPIELNHLFSHTHWDHIAGMPFFCPAYGAANTIHVHAGYLGPGGSIEAVLRQAISEPLFPVPLDVQHATVTFDDFVAGADLDLGDGILERTAPLNHPNGATGYRVEYNGKSICYVTDTEHVPGAPDQNILKLIKDADFVIYDSTYTDDEFSTYVGWGHSTWQEGVRLCKAAAHDLSRFFAPEIAQQIPAAEQEVSAGRGQAREAAILFLDIRGFTVFASTPCVLPLLDDPALLMPLSPFLDTLPLAVEKSRTRCSGPEPRLMYVDMMREGDKLSAYQTLTDALTRLADRPRRLETVARQLDDIVRAAHHRRAA